MIISVDGLMGSGKTTLLDELARRGYRVIREPVHEWKFLNKFYENPKKYSLALQLEILLSFVKYEFPENTIVFTERCPDVSYSVFAKLLSADNNLSEEEIVTYRRIYDCLAPWRPSLHVFLKTSLDTCERRVRQRGDSYTINAEYMKRVERYYDMYNKYTDIPVAHVSSDKTPEAIADEVLTMMQFV